MDVNLQFFVEALKQCLALDDGCSANWKMAAFAKRLYANGRAFENVGSLYSHVGPRLIKTEYCACS